MEVYLRTFVNQRQDDWARLLLNTKFAYNNTKNASTGHTLFELNCGYNSKVSFKENIDSRLKSRSINELAEELRKLIEVCNQNLLHVQELQKKTHDKGVKSCSYASCENIWLNSKYIKTKQNKTLKNKCFGAFQVLYLVKKVSVQTRATYEVEDERCIPHVLTGVEYYKERASV